MSIDEYKQNFEEMRKAHAVQLLLKKQEALKAKENSNSDESFDENSAASKNELEALEAQFKQEEDALKHKLNEQKAKCVLFLSLTYCTFILSKSPLLLSHC